MTGYYLLSLAIVLAGIFVILRLLRSRKIKEKYVWLWLGLLLVVVILLAVPGLADTVARFLGFQVPANLILTGAVMVLFGVSVTLSVALSKMEENVRTLSESISFLRLEVQQLRHTQALPQPGASPVDGLRTTEEPEA